MPKSSDDLYTTDRNFQAIIQLRPFNKKVYDFVLDLIKTRKNCFINKEVEQKTGIDIYVNESAFVMPIGKKLKNKFGGTVKVSRKLHSRDRQTSKAVYRVTICFRLNE
ncbi:MAG: NMD3-related protein [Candidatus Nanoarchaeia archaeon]|jgi:NMD protein affecting ribosome stability and mRNA decay|nr:NMD3-related protein [Candidatus Nanoarchaeia archaeon]|tara:strand:- start:13099 stop:13422 length:324 start_codon:yes stop_codon:yes gene_type:complete